MAETLITDRRSGSAHYKILRRLGKGGMAEVFLARQEGMAGLRRLTVVKKLLPQFSQMADVAEMLLDEARIAAQLTHPNIVQIFELGKEDNQYFIVMEFVDGCDLATLARIERHRQSRVPLRLTLRAVSEAAMGLDFAHRQTGLDGRPLNIVHRDVSPHNILCSREGAVKVTDFGIAKAVGKAQVTQVGVVKGKVQYMSPEQYTGGPVDHRSDIYSLGVVLYQLSTGRLPRVGDDGEVVMRRVLEGKVPRPAEVRQDYPEELEAIVMRALAHNPDDRYPDAASLRDDLLDFARENDLLAFPKDLGDYVNTMVPPVPVVVREQSSIQAEALSVAEEQDSPAPRSAHRLPSVIVEGEDLDTEAPSGTEPASGGTQPASPRVRRRPAVVADARSGPYDRTEASARHSAAQQGRTASSAALVPDEKLTPLSTSGPVLGETTPRLPVPPSSGAVLREQPLQPRDAHLEQAEPDRRTKSAEPKSRSVAAAAAGHRAPRPRSGQWSGEAADGRVARDVEEAVSSEPTPSGAGATRTGGPSAVTQQTTGRHGASAWMIIAAVSGLVALSVAGFTVWAVLSNRRPSSVAKPEQNGGSSAPQLGAGVINVLSNPSLAAVSVDGAQRCPSTPCQIAGLPLNRELLLTLRAHGYTLWMQRFVLTSSEPKLLLRADLSPETPATAASTDGGKAPAAETKKQKEKSGSGKKLPKSGQPIAKKGEATKSQGKMTTVDIEESEALLTVDVRPWAEVWMDGQKLGTTPMQKAVPPGPHKIELKNPELGYKKTYHIRAQLKKKVKISEALQPPPGQGGGQGGGG